MPSLTNLQQKVKLALDEIRQKNFDFVRYSVWPDIEEIIGGCDELHSDNERGWMRYFLWHRLDIAGNFYNPIMPINIAEILHSDIKEKLDHGEKPPNIPGNNTGGLV
jgi:hypothetical protein